MTTRDVPRTFPAVLAAIGKKPGDRVTVHLTERLG